MGTEAKTPAKLAVEGRRLWSQIIGAYDLRPDEVRILADACREADVVERLEVELRGSSLMVRGSQGQLVASPLVSEVRQHRTVLATLLKALKLPDTDSQGAQKAALESEQARAAARARWDRKRVAGA
jgi:hypothetical protein